MQHAKALALCISAYVRLAKHEQATRLAERLQSRARRTSSGAGWGYAFDVHMRWGSYAAGQPNAVVTSYAAHALLDLDDPERFDGPIADAMSLATSELVAFAGGEAYFVYCHGSKVPIHNANLLVASFVARASEPGSFQRDLASRAVAYTLARQRPDGSWPYGEAKSLAWVDGFHTAYILERLVQWYEFEPSLDVLDAITRGSAYFIDNLLDVDGAARATNLSRFPIETHAAASAITALTALLPYDDRAATIAPVVMQWSLDRLRRADGRFVYRRGRVLVNRVPYIRWSDAHMLLALANYIARAEA